MEFLDSDNAAGQNILQLVARGSSIIAELLRLSDHIPSVFTGTDPTEEVKYKDILFDFRYFKTSEAFDEKIDQSVDLLELDEEFQETHIALLGRFYKLFESIYKYYKDFNAYLDDLSNGVYVQHTFEGVLMDVEGKQLMSEALYLYGVMLLLLDLRIPGSTRERMIVSYYRYKGAQSVQNVEEVVKLCHSTGYNPNDTNAPRVVGYPEEYFARFPLNRSIVQMIIGRLRTDDIYNRNSAYPSPDHRSTALSTQAAMLYVVLYFEPNILHKKQAIMREIVDKHFNDNWVISFYMGFVVDLSTQWASYKAANLALGNILDKENVEDIMDKHSQLIKSLSKELVGYLVEGVLVEEYVLDNVRKLIQHVRNCNVTLRWLMLHRTTSHKKYHAAIKSVATDDEILMMLMNCAQFEFILKDMFQGLIASKEQRWEECRKEASERMIELSEYFSGEKALTRVKKNAKLQEWFKQLSDEIVTLEYTNATFAGRKIARLISALEEVEQFHQIETSLQVKTFLVDTREYLSKMIRTVNIKSQILADLDIVSDFSFAWLVIGDYVDRIHDKIRRDPSIVLLLRATFLKMSSILSLPLVRITQAESKDDVSVAEYYSSALVSFVRQVLDVIPKSVFKILGSITRLKTSRMKPIPMKLEREQLKEYAQLKERYELAKATHQVSVFTEGVLAMKKTFVGIIQLDPNELLEDGIRKQVVRQICVALNKHLIFTTNKKSEFEQRLISLGTELDGLKKSFEYIQDYIGVYGLKIWQQEFSRCINYYVEQESNSFLKKKIYDWQSKYQSDATPIPQFPRANKQNDQHLSVNFMGRLVRQVLQQTNPATTVFVESKQGWYELNSGGHEIVGIRTFDLLDRGVGVFGLTGMDRLLCFMIARDLRKFIGIYRNLLIQNPKLKNFLAQIENELSPTSQHPPDVLKLYQAAEQHTSKLFQVFLDYISRVGQYQLIRRQITTQLNFACKLDSKLLCCALEAMNSALINDVEAHYAKPDIMPYPGNPVLPELTKYLQTTGIVDPMTKIYVTTEPMESISLIMFLFVIHETSKLKWSHALSTLVSTVKAGKVPLDGVPLVTGVVTVLKQFHVSNTRRFLAYVGQYVRTNVDSQNGRGSASVIPTRIVSILYFLEEFCRYSKTSRAVIEQHIPSYIFDLFSAATHHK